MMTKFLLKLFQVLYVFQAKWAVCCPKVYYHNRPPKTLPVNNFTCITYTAVIKILAYKFIILGRPKALINEQAKQNSQRWHKDPQRTFRTKPGVRNIFFGLLYFAVHQLIPRESQRIQIVCALCKYSKRRRQSLRVPSMYEQTTGCRYHQ